MDFIILLIPGLLLFSFIFSGSIGNLVRRDFFNVISISCIFLAFALSSYLLGYLYFVDNEVQYNFIYHWISIPSLEISFGYLIDIFSIIMIFIVTFISLVVHIYSIAYMRDDIAYTRFFTYISFFTFSMLVLVMSNNLVQLFFGWEGVGLASYLLIGFWYKRSSSTKASLKAFLINRVGDMFFIIGIAVIFSIFGTFDYKTMFEEAQTLSLNTSSIFGLNPLDFACLLLFFGGMAKSAQIPLHIWLPDSMEGPTPISALIHAATMVTAGIFMVSRLSPLYNLSPFTLDLMLIIGSMTALLLGLVGIYQNDIKKVIAYSTISQLGYMVCILGLGLYSVAFFHLFTHAFFKALLFLSAGSVILSLHHNQDILKMGGLRKYMPITHACFLIGTLSLVGFPFTSGFFSKDLILESLLIESGVLPITAYFLLLIGTIITAIYSFRLLFLVFYGKNKSKEKSIKEQERIITIPLVVLAAGSIFAGYFISVFTGLPIYMNQGKSIFYTNISDFIIHSLLSPATICLVVGFLISKKLYLDGYKIRYSIKILEKIKNIIINKFYIDDFFQSIAIFFIKFSKDLFIHIDNKIIDYSVVNGIPRKIVKFSLLLRNIHSGYLYHSAFSIILSLVLIFGFIIYFSII